MSKKYINYSKEISTEKEIKKNLENKFKSFSEEVDRSIFRIKNQTNTSKTRYNSLSGKVYI